MTTSDNGKPGGNTIFIITYTVTLVVVLLNINATMSYLSWGLAIMSPFIGGLFIAFILNIAVKWLDEKVFVFMDKSKHKAVRRARRGLSVLVAFVLSISIIAGAFGFIIPQVVDSINRLVSNLPQYAVELQRITTEVLDWFHVKPNELNISWSSVTGNIGKVLMDFSPAMLTFAESVTGFLFNLIMSIIFSLYLLLGKERILGGLKKTLWVYLPERMFNKFYDVAHTAGETFTSFVVGQLTEAVILATMYFIGTSAFGMMYAPLISTMMAICSFIPLFGPYLGGGFSALILAMVNPTQALIFVIMAIVFQQIEGNFIYPRVVGGRLGLPGVWVLLAILIGGNVFGAAGMLLAVPFVSVVYALFKKSVEDRLAKKPQVVKAERAKAAEVKKEDIK